MQSRQVSLAVIFWVLVLFHAPAAVLYVDLNSINPTPPYGDWDTAATDIQSAVDASSDGDQIWVTNGVYQTGGRVVYGVLTNRVVINKSVTVQSVNGPAVTTIQGYQVVPGTTNGDSAVRCVYLTNNAALIGFTLTNGATRYLFSGDPIKEQSGGGVWCESTSGLVSNCIVAGNSCFIYGAGVYSGTVVDCEIVNNVNQITSGGGGGGVAYSTLINSTIIGNGITSGNFGGGAFNCSLSNCVVTRNLEGGVYGCTLSYCTVSENVSGNPLTGNGGGANQSILNNCTLYNNRATNSGGGAYNCTLNFCVISNNWAGIAGGIYASGGTFATNLPGQNNLVIGNTAGGSGGAFFGSFSSPVALILTNWTFISNSVVGIGAGLGLGSSQWLLKNCTFMGNSAGGSGGGLAYGNSNPFPMATNCTFTGNTSGSLGGGAYNVQLINCSITGNHAGSGGGIYGWATACIVSNNAAVTNGGGLYWNLSSGAATNCTFVNNSAAHGGGACIATGSSLLLAVTNCVFVANVASIDGGALWLGFGRCGNCLMVSNQAVLGAGVSVQGASGATNCIFLNNHASNQGGGAYGNANNGIFGQCTFSGNIADTSGGAAYGTTLMNCWVAKNVAATNGGGTYSCSLINCLVISNSAAVGGGAYLGTGISGPLNSTIVNNQASIAGGGVYFPASGSLGNCILYNNTAPSGANYMNGSTYNYCCTLPLPAGSHSFTNDPVFINPSAGSFRLQTNSPCINAGNFSPLVGSRDLDGRPRTVGGVIDIGAYEFQGPGIGEFIAWLQQYGLPADGSTDFIDSDGDGLNNWQEWRAGTNPTNALSVLKMASAAPTNSPSGLVVTWQSVGGIIYFLQNSTNLGAPPAFSTLQSNIIGQAGTTSYTDTAATNAGPYFYRVGVQ